MSIAARKLEASTEVAGDGPLSMRWGGEDRWSPSYHPQGDSLEPLGFAGASPTDQAEGEPVPGLARRDVTHGTATPDDLWARKELRGMRLVMQRVKGLARELAGQRVAFSAPDVFEYAEEDGEAPPQVQLAFDIIFDSEDREEIRAFRGAVIDRIAEELPPDQLTRLSVIVTGR